MPLNRARGKAIMQRVVVERVNVGSGGKAVVGAVANGGGGMTDNLVDQSHDARSSPFDRLPRCGAKTLGIDWLRMVDA
jgi:hypothetical protein